MSVSLTGQDTIILGQTGLAPRIMRDLADGDTAMLELPNNIVEVKTGKNGNSIYAFNATGRTSTVTVRVIRGSADDKYLNARYNEYLNDRAAFPLLEGEFVKRVGDGTGAVTSDTYRLSGGVIQKFPVVKENVEGDTEQSVAAWTILFTNTDRALT
jgi:hypothetical protein